jgi:spermidine dehydrogenase
MYHSSLSLAEAASLGDLRHPQSPDEPIVLHVMRTPNSPAKSRKEQNAIGRYDLITTTFETFERNIRDQLARVLGPGGFDPGGDIVTSTVNRWPQGYSDAYNSLDDPTEWVFTETNTPLV